MPPSITTSPLTDRHTQILKLIYRFRFLTRPQIQQLINHKSNSRLSLWLKQLTTDTYCCRYYSRTIKSQAAIYSLGTKGRKYLLQSNDPAITKQVLNRVWREPSLSLQTRKHHLLIADLYVAVSTLAQKNQAELSFYTKTELSMYEHLIQPTPDTYFVLAETSGLTNRFFVEIIDDFPARGQLIKLVFNYFTYYAKGFWQTHANKPFPYIILITPDARTAGMLFGLIRYKLKTNPDLNFFLLKRQDVPLLGIKTGLLTPVTLPKT
jgi:hypothetical protein